MMAVMRYLFEMYKFMRLPASQRQALIRQAETQARLRKVMKPKPAPKPSNEFVTVRYPNGYWCIEVAGA